MRSAQRARDVPGSGVTRADGGAGSESLVLDSLQRLGNIAAPPLEEIVPAESIFHYRNKLEYSFTSTPDGPALGFHRAGRWDEVLEIERCWLTTDLGSISTIRAIQINYADQDATLTGKVPGLCHQYVLRASNDGKNWATIVDKSENRADVPHDYVELPKPVDARFVRIENRQVPTGKFALSGLRVFGLGHGAMPKPVEGFVVLRGDSERRNAWLKWRGAADATGYVVYCGIAPDKLYSAIMIYGETELYFRAMDKDRVYFFQIEAFNEDGIGPRSGAIKAE